MIPLRWTDEVASMGVAKARTLIACAFSTRLLLQACPDTESLLLAASLAVQGPTSITNFSENQETHPKTHQKAQ